ncbi:hypothetical protein [Prevotella sp.]
MGTLTFQHGNINVPTPEHQDSTGGTFMFHGRERCLCSMQA